MTVVERPGKKVTPEETKRATYKPALSQPRGRVTPGGERGDPSGIEDKIYHSQKPRCGTGHELCAGLDKSHQTAEKKI